MKINWNKIIIDCIKVIFGVIAGATVTGCAFIPTFNI